MADALPTAGFSELIGSIYDCVLDPFPVGPRSPTWVRRSIVST
jgi:hypothetical protein